MHRHRARFAIVLSTLALFVLSPRPVAATPPRPPLDLEVRLLEVPPPGRPVRFTIDVTPLVPVAQLRVTILPPHGVDLVSGNASTMVRDAAPGRARRLAGTLRVPPGRRHYVYVRAEATTAAGHVWTRGTHLVVLAGPLAAPDPVRRVVPDGRGGSVVEFVGEPVTPQR